MLEAKRGDAEVTEGDQLTLEVRRDCDAGYLRRAEVFIRASVGEGAPFSVYFNHSLSVPLNEASPAGWSSVTGEMGARPTTHTPRVDVLSVGGLAVLPAALGSGQPASVDGQGLAGGHLSGDIGQPAGRGPSCRPEPLKGALGIQLFPAHQDPFGLLD